LNDGTRGRVTGGLAYASVPIAYTVTTDDGKEVNVNPDELRADDSIEIKVNRLVRIENRLKLRKARKINEICDIVAKGGSYLSVKDAEAIYDAVMDVKGH